MTLPDDQPIADPTAGHTISSYPAPEPGPASLTARQLLDLVAVVLIVVGVIGLGITTWLISPLIFAAVAFVAAIAGGVVLGLERG